MSKRSARRTRGRAFPTAPYNPAPDLTAVDLSYAVNKTKAKLKTASDAANPFDTKGTNHPPAVNAGLAMDSMFVEQAEWATNTYDTTLFGGMGFLGYPTLSVMATIAEYRRAVETIARHMTRKWIDIRTSGNEEKGDKIRKIEAEFKRLKVRKHFQKMAELDGYFGRGHLVLDFGDWDKLEELKVPIGDGHDDTSKGKCSPQRPLKRLVPVEPIWTYPLSYNTSNPLAPDWYKPQIWNIMGQNVHASRAMTFVGREVPDMLKPMYSFGGLSLSQMGRPTVDNWLQTRQSVNDIISKCSVMVMKTDLKNGLLNSAAKLFERIELFNAQRDNNGLLTLDAAEEFENVSVPLSGLDALQAQAQEHMASMWGIPVSVFTGNQPMGLNASSEGEMRIFYDWILACCENLFRDPLETILRFVQLSLFGEVDEDIEFEFNDLEGMDEGAAAQVELTKAQVHQTYTDMGAVTGDEVRRSLIDDPNSLYHGLSDEAPRASEKEPPSSWDALAGSIRAA